MSGCCLHGGQDLYPSGGILLGFRLDHDRYKASGGLWL